MKFSFLILGAILAGSSAWASIGLNASTIQDDCDQLNGTYSVIKPGVQFRCQAINLTVDFYTNTQGTITHITWKGRRTPAMNVLLGSNSDDYIKAVENARGLKAVRTPIHHETSKVIVNRAGNARLHVGEIILKSAI